MPAITASRRRHSGGARRCESIVSRVSYLLLPAPWIEGGPLRVTEVSTQDRPTYLTSPERGAQQTDRWRAEDDEVEPLEPRSPPPRDNASRGPGLGTVRFHATAYEA